MTPLTLELNPLIHLKRIRQKDLANMLGVDPTYLSAVINGRKNPPGEAFFDKLRDKLDLSEEESKRLEQAISYSQKRYLMPDHAEPYQYELAWHFMNMLETLKPGQASAIREILKL